MHMIKKKALLFILLLSSLVLFAACTSSTQEAVKGKKDQPEIQDISTQDLQSKIGQKDWVIVDTRLNDAFNGWALDGVARGGRIKGAVDFSANWLKVEIENREEKLQQILETKGITPEKNIVLYDANGKDAVEVADYLISKGMKHIYKYDVKEWAASKELPMESYENYHLLVPAVWVNDLIQTQNNGKPYRIFEVSWGEESQDYKKGHIPGAVHINTDEVEEPPLWNRKSPENLEKFALLNGITYDTTVVLYGSDSMAAFRVAAILKYMGVEDVRVLNGGFATWVNAGYDVETQANDKTSVDSFGATIPANPDYIIDLPQAKEILADANGSKLVDIRSWDEYTGKITGYDYIKAKGRPAGAVWGYAGSDPNHLEDFRNIDNTMRNGSEIINMWQEWGITPDQRLAFYCGTGWRAAEVLIYADVMGLKNISLYDGGWYEWSSDPANPVEIGEPKQK
ncbi:rhodanese-like domain-containing protein [Thermotalea metallivorans]|uniref:Thiosulfate sulfurtransferase YnjE n=1 Tax=Thermotalea metallivorans TaxID=520762 RepID=A0A140L7Z3_9FIRM|nr:rhodanese-like domain-containing protein [Thermotalea metallivorans]KXG76668.1 Thiosulfate sulfurtransferase YnjE [Thermotalea metallivorans]